MIDTEQKHIFPTNDGNQPLPNAVAVLVLGILSIVFCVGYGVGVILGIIALVLANRDRKLYQLNPGLYSVSSYNNLNAGRTCAIIGLALSGLFVMFIIMALVFAISMTNPFLH